MAYLLQVKGIETQTEIDNEGLLFTARTTSCVWRPSAGLDLGNLDKRHSWPNGYRPLLLPCSLGDAASINTRA